MKSILLVEDDQILVEALKKKLESVNYTVLVAHDGDEGIKVFRQNHIDLILLDILMPKMQGLEMLKTLQSTEQNLPPVVILTNLDQTEKPAGVVKILYKDTTSLDRLVTELQTII